MCEPQYHSDKYCYKTYEIMIGKIKEHIKNNNKQEVIDILTRCINERIRTLKCRKKIGLYIDNIHRLNIVNLLIFRDIMNDIFITNSDILGIVNIQYNFIIRYVKDNDVAKIEIRDGIGTIYFRNSITGEYDKYKNYRPEDENIQIP